MKTMRPYAELIQKSKIAFFLTPLTLFLLVMTGQANTQRIITFDAPNSGTGAGQGTVAASINNVGAITGNVTDNNNGTHGFVRTPDARFTDFDAPGANPVVGCTCPLSINDLGVVAGYDVDTNSVYHGFVRTPDGQIIIFDDSQAPAGTGANQGTTPVGVNDIGVITGYYIDGNNATHGFVRTPDGKITTFDAPGASDGTYPGNINNFGVIAGSFYDTNGVGHGFVRTAGGQVTTFDPPNSVSGPTSYGTSSAFINDLGVIAGSYYDASTSVEYGYVLWPGGQFTEFAAPNAGTVAYAGTQVSAVNLEGATTGGVLDDNFEYHSFVRAADGTASTYNVQGQIMVPDSDAGSLAVGINALGVVAGHWRDPNLTYHAYLRTP
jgi:hypothetical protein